MLEYNLLHWSTRFKPAPGDQVYRPCCDRVWIKEHFFISPERYTCWECRVLWIRKQSKLQCALVRLAHAENVNKIWERSRFTSISLLRGDMDLASLANLNLSTEKILWILQESTPAKKQNHNPSTSVLGEGDTSKNTQSPARNNMREPQNVGARLLLTGLLFIVFL